MQLRVSGSVELKRFAAAVKATGNKGLGREMAAGLRKAGKPIQESIKDTFTETLPERGGYRAAASKSVRFRTNIRSGPRAGTVRITTYAVGKGENRDLPRINKGQLRHPVFGRSRNTFAGKSRRRVPNPWATTRVTPRFFERGIDKAKGAVEKEMLAVLADYTRRLTRG